MLTILIFKIKNGKVYNFNSEKYDEEYFDNKSLAIINIIIGNSSNSLKNIDISVIDNILVCKANIESGNEITDNINGKFNTSGNR